MTLTHTALFWEDYADQTLFDMNITPDEWMQMTPGQQFYELERYGYIELEPDIREVDTEGLWESPE